jgi:hypothetical protein
VRYKRHFEFEIGVCRDVTFVTKIQRYFLYYDQTRVCEQEQKKLFKSKDSEFLLFHAFVTGSLKGKASWGYGTGITYYLFVFKMILCERNFIKQQDYSWKAKCCCANRDKLVFSWKYSLHYRVNRSLPLCSILSQTNAVNINLTCKCSRRLTIALKTLGLLYCLIYDLLNGAVSVFVCTASKIQHLVSIRSLYYTLHSLVFLVYVFLKTKNFVHSSFTPFTPSLCP